MTNYALKRSRKAALVDLMELLTRNLPEGTEEIHENPVMIADVPNLARIKYKFTELPLSETARLAIYV